MVTLAMAGVILLGQGAWIHAKALLGQALMNQAWSEQQNTGRKVAPWPWADTWPVARLRADRVQADQLVLANASGRNLAWGPTHVAPSALPGIGSHSVFSGHRDTHFRFLSELQIGDLLEVEHRHGSIDYEVVATEIIDLRLQSVLLEPEQARLTLVTCYPFDAISSDTPYRYLVHANRRVEVQATSTSISL
jgi:sortase A